MYEDALLGHGWPHETGTTCLSCCLSLHFAGSLAQCRDHLSDDANHRLARLFAKSLGVLDAVCVTDLQSVDLMCCIQQT